MIIYRETPTENKSSLRWPLECCISCSWLLISYKLLDVLYLSSEVPMVRRVARYRQRDLLGEQSIVGWEQNRMTLTGALKQVAECAEL